MTKEELGERLKSVGLKEKPVILIDDERPLLGVKVKSRRPLADWDRFRGFSSELGCWPLIIPTEKQTLDLISEGLTGFGEGAPPAESLLDVVDGPGALAHLETNHESEPEMGSWPGQLAGTGRYTLIKKPKAGLFGSELILAMIPASHPWEVFAYLNYGGWNDCPGPESHVGIHRMWNEKYGAEPVTLAHDTLECRVPNPPSDKDSAMALAREHYYYCYDIVDQGVQSLSNLGATLLNNNIWYFWWD